MDCLLLSAFVHVDKLGQLYKSHAVYSAGVDIGIAIASLMLTLQCTVKTTIVMFVSYSALPRYSTCTAVLVNGNLLASNVSLPLTVQYKLTNLHCM